MAAISRLSDLPSTLTVFMTGTFGVLIALLVHQAPWTTVAVIAGGVFLACVAIVLHLVGRFSLPDHPERAVHWLSAGAIVGAWTTAVTGTVLVVALTVVFTPGPAADVTTQKILSTAIGIASGAVAALATERMNDPDGAVADLVRRPFESAYNDKVRFPDPDLAEGVYAGAFSGHTGWGRVAREARARAIADRLRRP